MLKTEPLLKSFWNHSVIKAIFLVFATILAGAIGFYLIELIFSPRAASHAFLDAIYLAVVTLTTVGYGDNLELLSLPNPGRTVAEIFSISYLLVGYGVAIWASSTVIAYVVEGSLFGILEERRILRRIKMLKNHYILCGIGRTGVTIVDEFKKSGHLMVIVDYSNDHVMSLKVNYKDTELLTITGDATEEEVLKQAGIENATGLICNLSNDRDNLYLTLTGRDMNPNMRIITRAIDVKSREKLLKAGADSVVFPSNIGALRMVSEMIRPTVVSFLDKMLRDRRDERVSEVTVHKNSDYIGKSLKESNIYKDTLMLVIAMLKQNSDEFIYNPSADDVIEEGTVLVVIGDKNRISKLKLRAKS